MTELFNSYKHKVLGDFFISDYFNLTNFRMTDLKIDEGVVPLEFHPEKHGVYLQLIEVQDWTIGIDYEFWPGFWDYRLSGPIEYHFDRFSLKTGIDLGLEDHKERGKTEAGVHMQLFDFSLEEGDSAWFFGPSLFMKFLAASVNFPLKPTTYLTNQFFEPIFNYWYEEIFEPYIIHSGEIVLPFDYFGFGTLEYDWDLAFTKPPVVTEDSVEIYLDAGLTVLNEYLYDIPPQHEMSFIDNENLGFQMCISDFVVNELIGTIIMTNLTDVIPSDLIF